MKSAQVIGCALISLAMASAAQAALYGATSAGGPGELYRLNPANGAMIQDIGPLNDAAGLNYPITGLAISPLTGVMYGSTGNSASAAAAKLVTINPATGAVTLVGSFNAGPTNSGGTPATMADLEFDAAGNLYGVTSIGGPQLYTINTGTGQATVIGTTGLTSTSGGGVAITAAGTIFGTPTSTRFGTYNSVTGAFTNIAAPARPLGGAYAALAFGGGQIYGLDLGPGPTLATELVTIDPTTGAVTDLGPSVAALDAITFSVPEPATLGALGVVAVGAMSQGRRRK